MARARYIKVEIDDHELAVLEADIAGAPWRVTKNARVALTKSAELVDEQMTIDATGHMGNWFGIPGTSYPTPLEEHVSHELLDPWTAEIGIEKKGAGSLAHIIVLGRGGRNAPAYDHTLALRRSTKKVVDIFADAAEKSVLGDD